MKYLYWIAAIALIGAGLYVATQVEVQPPVVQKIKFSQFQEPEAFGKEIFQQLHKEIKESPLIFLGVTPNQIEDVELWRGFLEAAKAEGPGVAYDVIVVEPMLPYVEIFVSDMRIDIKAEPQRFIEGVKKAMADGMRVAVIVPTIYSSQLLQRNPVDFFKNQNGLDMLSLSVAKFPLTEAQEAVFEPKCVLEQGVDHAGTGKLGCAIRTAARKTYRLQTETGKYSGFVEQVGPKDFLVLFNRN